MTSIKPQTILSIALLFSALTTVGATFVSPQGGTGKENTNAQKAGPTPKKTPRRTTHQTNAGNDKDEIEFWDSIKNSTDPEDFKAYLQKYPNGKFAILARNRLNKLETKPSPTPTPSSSPGNAGPGIGGTQATMVRNRIGMELMWIPSGSFVMGSTNGQPDQVPAHRVTINYSFLMGKYEVTQEQWRLVTGRSVREQRDRVNPGFGTAGEGDLYPIYYVTWYEAQEFIQKLNQMNDGYLYRLPSEAEWEYACRAGSTTDDSGNLAAVAWYGNNSGKTYLDATALWPTGQSNYGQQILRNGNQAHPVGTKRPNAFGLYDMLGNVYEWCQDYYHPDYVGAPADGSAWLSGGEQKTRVLRGGSWYLTGIFARPSARMYYSPEISRSHYGFRVVATPRTQTVSDNSSADNSISKSTPITVVRDKVGIDLVLISPGSFLMGSTGGPDETPVHRVTINYPFYIGRYEVTQAQWQDQMGNNPSYFKDCGGNCPVEQVSWNDAQAFISKLNSLKDGFKYRLPSEAEWEYACRAGTTGDFYGADVNSIAWYSLNSSGKTWAVGGKNPNAFGLYDMAGNVFEWCADLYHRNYSGAPVDGSAWFSGGDPTYRVLRSGSWYFGADLLRSAYRRGGSPDLRTNRIGFRLAATRQ